MHIDKDYAHSEIIPMIRIDGVCSECKNKNGCDSEHGEKARNSRRVHNSKLRLSVREIRSINETRKQMFQMGDQMRNGSSLFAKN